MQEPVIVSLTHWGKENIKEVQSLLANFGSFEMQPAIGTFTGRCEASALEHILAIHGVNDVLSDPGDMTLLSGQENMRCIGNYHKSDAAYVGQAAVNTGSAVEWRGEPDEYQTLRRDECGSIWSAEDDLSNFWREFDRLRNEGLSSYVA